MAKRQRKTDQAVINKRTKEGRGQGKGADYKPWLHIQDVPSNGLVHRIRGWKTQREHHFLSTLECDYFYVLEWSPLVCDVREQYPLLPLTETLALAEKCGFRHPTDPKTKEPIVMTTDFIVTVARETGETDLARTIKPSAKLQSQRVLEKLEVERCYWRARNVDWGIVTEHEIPRVFAKNVKLVHGYLQVADRLSYTEKEINGIASVLTECMVEAKASLRHAAADCDRRLGCEPGTSLTIAYHLLARRSWRVDMSIPIEPGKTLVLVNAGEFSQARGGRS
jgi:hypothetical protein